MATIYYVDSENVGDSWIELLDDPEGRVIVFYTGRSPRIAYPQVIRLMNASHMPEFVECYEGNNGLDFQLVSYLGYELHTDSSNEMIIVSNDTGFDAVVHFWKDRGMDIKRNPHPNASNLQPVVRKEPVSVEDVDTKPPAAEVPEMLNGIDRSELYTIINCIGVKNMASIHLALVHFYGIKNGENTYRCLKKEGFKTPAVNWDKETKMKYLIALILRYCNASNLSLPDTLTGFIVSNVVDDKGAMGNKLQATYGKPGTQINSMFKPFYKTLAKIKKK